LGAPCFFGTRRVGRGHIVVCFEGFVKSACNDA
jgi:hypothetical protein